MRWFRSNKGTGVNGSPKIGDLPTIVARDIKSVGVLDGPHYVFVLTMNTGDQVVLKAEMNIASANKSMSHDLGLRIMGAVSAVKAQTLSPMEEKQIQLLDSGITMDFFRAEKQVEAGNAKWVKAAYQAGLAGLASNQNYLKDVWVGNDKQTHMDAAERKKLRPKIAKLQLQLAGNTKAWKSLGRIAAADALLGNADRIDIDAGEIANWGNLQFREFNGQISKAIGLDSMDGAPNSYLAILYETPDNDSFMTEWRNRFGRFLKTPKDALPQMKIIMERANKRMFDDFSEQGSWGDKEAKALYDGFVDGIKTLKPQMKSLAKKQAQATTKPTILLERFKYLGWAV